MEIPLVFRTLDVDKSQQSAEHVDRIINFGILKLGYRDK